MARDVRVSRIVSASRTHTWSVLTIPEQVTTWFAPAANVDLGVAGVYQLGFDGALEDGGPLINFSLYQELVIDWACPARLGGQRSRVRLLLEPLGDEETRVLVVHEFYEDDHRIADHVGAAWEDVLDRLAWRLMLEAPAMEQYRSFWQGM